MVILRLISRKWLLTTLLVVAAMAVLGRLGVWQLDRLAQRRAFNARVLAQTDLPALILDANTMQEDLPVMEYRQVTVTGEYDFAHQVALRNQVWQDNYGVRLLTPLHIDGTDQAVLVDRGWISDQDFKAGDWSQFDEPGTVTVNGVIRAPQSRPDFGRISDPTPVPGGPFQKAWNLANVTQMAKQVPYPLLGIYIQQAPDPSWTALPYRSLPVLDLTEGPHQSYAIQWFSFAAVLGLGYPIFILREEKRRSG